MFILPDKGLEAGTSDSLRDVREELQTELTEKIILLLQGQQHKVWTHTVEEYNGKWSHITEIIVDLLVVVQFVFTTSLQQQCKPSHFHSMAGFGIYQGIKVQEYFL